MIETMAAQIKRKKRMPETCPTGSRNETFLEPHVERMWQSVTVRASVGHAYDHDDDDTASII